MRFNTKRIREQAEDYCVARVVDKINFLGGVDEDKYLPRKIDLKGDGSYQLGLFDKLADS